MRLRAARLSPPRSTFTPSSLHSPLQLAGTPDAPWLDLLELFAYGTWTDYKGKRKGERRTRGASHSPMFQHHHFSPSLLSI
jgi:hypothetical protein